MPEGSRLWTRKQELKILQNRQFRKNLYFRAKLACVGQRTGMDGEAISELPPIHDVAEPLEVLE